MIPYPGESSLSSRSISKDKKTTSLPKRLRPTGKYLNKNKNMYEDESTPSGTKQAWKKKRSLPGLSKKANGSSSQRSINSNDAIQNSNKSLTLSVSR